MFATSLFNGDAALMLHHVIDHGIERRPIFVTDADRVDFVDRLAAVVAAEAEKGGEYSPTPRTPARAPGTRTTPQAK
jgi:hypothetical protein